MNIDTLYLRNYRCFTELAIDFHPNLTVIAAENGGGKTAILDAITVAFGPFVGGFDEGKGRGFNAEDVLLLRTEQTQTVEMEAQYPIALQAKGEVTGQAIEWQRVLNGKKSKTTIKEAQDLTAVAKKLQTQIRDGETVVLPLLAYYGTGRLWRESKLTANRKMLDSQSRLAGYNECLNPASSYRIFADWFAYLARADFEYQMQQHQANAGVTHSEFAQLLACVKQAVDTCLHVSGWKNLQYRASLQTLTVEHPQQGRLPVDQLSDGIRNLLAMVGDIAYRAARLNSHLKDQAALKTPGIVLIDEVDLHLHPRWQQTVLHDLTTAFPHLQFIVTTHSPQVLSTVKRDNIRLPNIAEKRALQPVTNPYGRESREALEDIFDVDSRPPREVVAETGLLNDYLKQVERGKYNTPEALIMRKQLEEVYGEGDIHLQIADMVIHKQQAQQHNSS